MRKKIDLIILLAALLLLTGFVFMLNKGQGRYEDFVVSDSESEEIMSARTLDEGMLVDVFFDGQKLMRDTATGDYYYSVVEDSLTAYNPSVRTSLSGKRVKIAFVDGHLGDELIKTDTPVKTLIYDDDSYICSDLICTSLPVMNMECDQEIGDLDTEMSITLFDNSRSSSARVVQSDGFARVRGVMSREYPKKSFRVSLKKKSLGYHQRNNSISLLGMRKDDDWILYSCYSDTDKVRNIFSQNLWTESCGRDNAYNINTGGQYKYVELFMNGQYWGLYGLGYKADEKVMDIGNLGASEGLFKKSNYMLSGFQSDGSLSPIYDYYCSLEEHAYDSEYLKKELDLDNILDFNLFINLVQGVDNLEHNHSVLLKQFSDGKKVIYIPWDLDQTWGSQWSYYAQNNMCFDEVTPEQNVLFWENALFQLLLNNDQETYDRLFEKYRELRATGWSDEAVEKLIRECEIMVFDSGAYNRDHERWPEAGYTEGSTSLDGFRDYVHKRFAEMDAAVDRLEKERTDNCFINQTLRFKNPDQAVFVVEINDKSLLADERYSGFLEYLGADVSKITDDVRYVVCDMGKGKAEYVSGLDGMDTSYEGELGSLELAFSPIEDYEFDGDYTVFFNGISCFNTSPEDTEPILAAAVYGGFGEKLYMDTSFRARSDCNTIPDTGIWYRMLDDLPGSIILQVNTTDSSYFIRDGFLEQFDIDYGEYGSLDNAIASGSELVFLLNGKGRRGCIIENPYVSGTVKETEFGVYSYFEGEDSYGIYLNGNEFQADSLDNLYRYDVIITQFNKDWTEQRYRYAVGDHSE